MNRERRMIKCPIKPAKFPVTKSLGSIDWSECDGAYRQSKQKSCDSSTMMGRDSFEPDVTRRILPLGGTPDAVHAADQARRLEDFRRLTQCPARSCTCWPSASRTTAPGRRG